MVIRQKSDKTVGLGGVVPGGPAEKAGILESDELVSVDGQGIEGKSVMALVAMIRGVPHTTVNIVVRRNGKLITYSLVREKITLPSGGSCALKHKNQSPPKI
jgi:C-terminal processing protease CtpA/Prc